MNERVLEQFFQKIAPFRELWQVVRVSCFAVRRAGVWLSLAVRVMLRESPAAPMSTISPGPEFLAWVVDLPMSRLDEVLDNMVANGFVSFEIGASFVKAYLTREHAGLAEGTGTRINWGGVVKHQRPYFLREPRIDRTCISIMTNAERILDVADNDLVHKINSDLRLHDPSYDGLQGLCTDLMPGVSSGSACTWRVTRPR